MPIHVPKYRHHKPTGQALVQLGGKRHYLGKYDSPASRERYRQLVAEHLVEKTLPTTATTTSGHEVTINELILTYFHFAQSYYVKDGKPTNEVDPIDWTTRSRFLDRKNLFV